MCTGMWPFFKTRPSTTEAILHLWEARNREILAVSNLTNILRGMGRFDAAAVIEQQIHWKEPKLYWKSHKFIESQEIEEKSCENTAVNWTLIWFCCRYKTANSLNYEKLKKNLVKPLQFTEHCCDAAVVIEQQIHWITRSGRKFSWNYCSEMNIILMLLLL